MDSFADEGYREESYDLDSGLTVPDIDLPTMDVGMDIDFEKRPPSSMSIKELEPSWSGMTPEMNNITEVSNPSTSDHSDSDHSSGGDRGVNMFLPAIKEPGDTNLKTQIGLSHLPDQRQTHVQKLGSQFNLMVAGQIGTGKTTFINTLFNGELFNLQKESLMEDNSNYSESLKISRFELLEQNFPLRLNVIETSGFGMGVNNEGCWFPISDYIEDQFKRYLFQDHQPDRKLKYDNRVHCCIYFLSPHLKQLSPLDLNTIKALTNRVNVIPVIGKSDCLNSDELRALKISLNHQFEVNRIKFCDLLNDEELLLKINDNLPFSVIGSNEVIFDKNDTPSRTRTYPWGVINIYDPKFCQFNLVSNILIKENMLDFIISTENHYEIFRNEFLKEALTRLQENNNHPLLENGLEEIKAYSTYTYSQYIKTSKEKNQILQYKENILKNKFNEEISSQEKRFKEWKRNLVAKQNELNEDIEYHHDKLIELQEAITALEEDLGNCSPSSNGNNSNKNFNTLFRKTLLIDNEITTEKQEMKLLGFPIN